LCNPDGVVCFVAPCPWVAPGATWSPVSQTGQSNEGLFERRNNGTAMSAKNLAGHMTNGRRYANILADIQSKTLWTDMDAACSGDIHVVRPKPSWTKRHSKRSGQTNVAQTLGFPFVAAALLLRFQQKHLKWEPHRDRTANRAKRLPFRESNDETIEPRSGSTSKPRVDTRGFKRRNP